MAKNSFGALIFEMDVTPGKIPFALKS